MASDGRAALSQRLGRASSPGPTSERPPAQQAVAAAAAKPQSQHGALLRRVPSSALIWAGVGLRLLLIVIAEIQDLHAEVPYTDVDYQVFTDAAESVALGLSPYAPRTALLRAEATRYRYTPLLAYALLPNVWLHKAWGKVLFSILDIVAALILRAWLDDHVDDPLTSKLGLCLWLFNPFCFTISTRGSCESAVVVMLYISFTLIGSRKHLFISAVSFGLATHWRVYPIVFSLPILLWLGRDRRGILRLLHFDGFVFGSIAAGTFVSLGVFFTWMYGVDFYEGAFLYHSRRSDPQHNFSVYFYPVALYLEGRLGGFPNLARWAALPQLGLCVWLGWSKSGHVFAVAILLQAIALVATNKVMTAQYFVWWWAMLPFALPWLEWRRADFGWALLAWAAAEVHWLLWAYLLEFRKLQVRPVVWLASCVFLVAHGHLVRVLLRCASSAAAKSRPVGGQSAMHGTQADAKGRVRLH